MERIRKAMLLLRVLWEFLRYEAVDALKGFAGVRLHYSRCARRRRKKGAMAEASLICRAVGCMSSFYWKPLLCLQRSVVTARVLRAYGIQADVVIGYRAFPFLSHAWVEVGGRVVNDSPAYCQKMQVLDRF